jgi:hypothetical protein
MNKNKIIVVILSVLYILTAIVSYILGINSLLFFLSLPWAMVPLILSAMTHSYPNDYWLLIGSLLNPIILLWSVVIKPAINKTGEVSE